MRDDKIHFAMPYGVSPEHAKKLVDAKDLTPEAAQKLMEDWKQTFPTLFEAFDDWAKREGYKIDYRARRARPVSGNRP